MTAIICLNTRNLVQILFWWNKNFPDSVILPPKNGKFMAWSPSLSKAQNLHLTEAFVL